VILEKADVCIRVADIHRKHDTTDVTYYNWKATDDTTLAQFVADPNLTMRRKVDNILRDSWFDLGLNAVLRVGFAAVSLQQDLDTAFLNRALVAGERIPGQACHLTGLRDIAQFLGQRFSRPTLCLMILSLVMSMRLPLT